MSKPIRLKKESIEAILALLKKMKKPIKKMVKEAEESGNEYMFYLSQMSIAKAEDPELSGGFKKSDNTMMKDSFILAGLIHFGANYTDVLRVAEKFKNVAGLMASMDMIDQSVDSLKD